MHRYVIGLIILLVSALPGVAGAYYPAVRPALIRPASQVYTMPTVRNYPAIVKPANQPVYNRPQAVDRRKTTANIGSDSHEHDHDHSHDSVGVKQIIRGIFSLF